jgi:hypothetical protein
MANETPGIKYLLEQQQDTAKQVPPPARQRLLSEASQCVMADRNKAYGNPEDNFTNIAEAWNLYLAQSSKLGRRLNAMDVAYMMIHMKMVRLATNPTHRDSLVDIAGYAACGADCQEVYQSSGAGLHNQATIKSN